MWSLGRHVNCGRPSTEEFLKCEYFLHGPMETIRKLEALMGLDDEEKLAFLKHLPERLTPFPPPVMRDLVLPLLQQLQVNKVRVCLATPTSHLASSAMVYHIIHRV